MVQIFHYDILLAIAERIVAELYDVARKDSRIMVCDWCAYAVLEAYRQYADLIDDVAIPDIEQCFSGVATPAGLTDDENWKALAEMHLINWLHSKEQDGETIYADYLNQSELVLEHYVLSL